MIDHGGDEKIVSDDTKHLKKHLRNHLDLNDVEAGNRVPVRAMTPPMNHGSN